MASPVTRVHFLPPSSSLPPLPPRQQQRTLPRVHPLHRLSRPRPRLRRRLGHGPRPPNILSRRRPPLLAISKPPIAHPLNPLHKHKRPNPLRHTVAYPPRRLALRIPKLHLAVPLPPRLRPAQTLQPAQEAPLLPARRVSAVQPAGPRRWVQ